MIAAVIITVLFTAYVCWSQREHRLELAAIRAEYGAERSGLIAQIQANAQHLPYYPQVGPFVDEGPEQAWVSDDSGLISFPVDEILEDVADR